MVNTRKHNGRQTRLLGGYVPAPLLAAVRVWVRRSPERTVSTFIREASREKLRRDGIKLESHS